DRARQTVRAVSRPSAGCRRSPRNSAEPLGARAGYRCSGTVFGERRGGLHHRRSVAGRWRVFHRFLWHGRGKHRYRSRQSLTGELSTLNFDLTDDQEMLRGSFARFLDENSSTARVRAALPSGFDQSLWKGLGELGAFAIRVPESAGGLGLGLLDAA